MHYNRVLSSVVREVTVFASGYTKKPENVVYLPWLL